MRSTLKRLARVGAAATLLFALAGTGSMAYAAATPSGPQQPHGTCGIGGQSSSGAFGCAGNVGGFIVTPTGKCIEQGTPFSQFIGACQIP